MAKIIKVLSIDGGGIRGIIPAMVLAEIEKRTGKHIAELFHLIAGTSTGGIIGLALTKPGTNGKPAYKAEQLIELYEEKCEDIFPHRDKSKFHLFSRFRDIKYPSEGIESVFQEYFGSTTLRESLTDVLVTSYDFERQKPMFFKSSSARRSPERNFQMKDAARATSSVPVYFEPMKLETESIEEYYALVDGLLFAGNPTLCAYAEAKGDHPDTRDILVVSLGTGRAKHRQIYEEVREWGLLQWGRNILDMMLQGTSMAVDYQMRQLLPTHGDSSMYYRFQTKLDKVNEAMDDTDPTNIRILKLIAEEMIIENATQIDYLCRKLLK